MSKTISVRLSGAKLSATSGQKRHDAREGKQPGYIDAERAHTNSIIIKPKTGNQLHKICEELRFENGAKRKMKSTSHVSTGGIITFGIEAQEIINKMSVQTQDKVFSDVAKKIAGEFNNDLTGLTVHRDESAIHAHFQMPAINKNGKPNTKLHIDYSHVQDIAGECVKAYNISRGVKKSERIAKGEPDHKHIHMSVRQLHDKLPEQIDLAQKALYDTKARLESALKPLSTPPLKPVITEVVKKKRIFGYDETVCAKVYTFKQVDSFLREQYTKAQLLEHDNSDAQEALRALKTAESDIKRLLTVESSLKQALVSSKAHSDDLERVLHDRGITKNALDTEIEKSKSLGAETHLR